MGTYFRPKLLIIDQFDWKWLPILGLGLLDILLAPRFGMRFIGWGRFSLLLVFPAAVAGYYRVSRRSDRLADAGYYITLWLLFSTLACILTYIAARLDLPLRDLQFTHFDELLSFDWGRWTTFVASHKRFELLLAFAYSTILPQTIGSVIYFAHIRRPDRNDDLLWTTMVAAIITTAVFGLLPALGPRFKGQYVDWSATLAAIRDGSASTFSLQHLQGVIAFPSFHTVAAILLIYSHRPPVPSFGLMLVLNLLMLLSTPSEGQHYLVDVVAGSVVAAISAAAVRLATRPRAHLSRESVAPAAP
jgi:membrane-associated phospholipid phosphatase